jgi:hypothetical protein
MILIAAVLLALTGCAANSSTATPSSPSPSPAASESSPANDVAEVTDPVKFTSTVRVSGNGISAIDSTRAVLFSYPWTEDGDGIVTDLTALLGSAPSESFTEGDSSHSSPRNVYTWDGISVSVSTYQHADGEFHFDPIVTITAAAHGTIKLQTSNGISVGDTVDSSLDTLAIGFSDEGYARYYFEPDPESQGQFRAVEAIVDTSDSVVSLVTPSDAGRGL